MISLKSLVENVLISTETTARSGSGIAAWVVWKNELDPSVEQAFQDYGGTPVVRSKESGVWFFFSVEAYMAFARVQLWAKLHNFALSVVVMPAWIYLGDDNSRGIHLSLDMLEQGLALPEKFNIWVHPEIQELGRGIPGLIFQPAQPPADLASLASVAWCTVYADTRLSYRTTFGWYCVLKPLGNPLEKRFQTGWHDFFGELENVLQRQKLKYTLHNNFLLFPMDTLSQFRTWCLDFFALIDRLKQEEQEGKGEKYWPCVQAMVDKKYFAFNNDLPAKVNLDWDQIMPDFPHMSYRNAYLLGDDFMIHSVRFDSGKNSLDDWCNISLKQSDDNSSGLLPIILPVSLVSGKENHCFYCGLRTHLPASCPSRLVLEHRQGVWKQIATMNFGEMNSALKDVGSNFAANVEEGLGELLLASEETPATTMAQAIFDINSPVQYQMLRVIWTSNLKSYAPNMVAGTGNKDDLPLWQFLEKMPAGELIPLEKELQELLHHMPRDYRLITLNGLLALERQDEIRASMLWKEAENIASTPLQKGHIQFLQARLLEIEGKYEHASAGYGKVLFECPDWLEARYRQIVCEVKNGFADHAMISLLGLIERNPNFFNRALIDPEMERGHIQLLSSLHIPWDKAEQLMPAEMAALQNMAAELKIWFPEEHKFSEKMTGKIAKLLELSKVANYVPYQRIIHNRAGLEREMQDRVRAESLNLRTTFKAFKIRLTRLKAEAAWFPFPGLLAGFQRTFNKVNQNTEWALKANMGVSETFNKAQRLAEKDEEKLKGLESKIKFLKIVRDSTLFALLMGKLFLILEVLALILTFAVVPLVLFYTEKTGGSFISSTLLSQRWELQKALVFIFSILAFGLSALRTFYTFEKKRDKLLKKDGEEKPKK